MRRTSISALVLLLFLAPAVAAAQIVNVQTRFSGEPQPGFHGALESSVDWRTGNTDYLALRGAVSVQGAFGPHVILGLVQGEYGFTGDNLSLARIFEHVRYRRRIEGPVLLEAFAQHEADRFRRLELRALVGAGPRFELLSGPKRGLSLGVALMAEHERLRDLAQLEAGAPRTDLRVSSYLIGRFSLAERLEVVETLYLQPRIDRPSDLRVLNDTALVVRANQHVGMSIAFVLTHDAVPPEGVKPTDTQLRTALAVSF